jgi:hypothetical protein
MAHLELFLPNQHLNRLSVLSMQSMKQPAATSGQNEAPTVQSPPPNEPRLSEQRDEPKSHTFGRFVLGPRDDLDTLDDLDEGSPEPQADGRSKSRIIHRILHVQMTGSEEMKQLQAVIYVVNNDLYL